MHPHPHLIDPLVTARRAELEAAACRLRLAATGRPTRPRVPSPNRHVRRRRTGSA